MGINQVEMKRVNEGKEKGFSRRRLKEGGGRGIFRIRLNPGFGDGHVKAD